MHSSPHLLSLVFASAAVLGGCAMDHPLDEAREFGRAPGEKADAPGAADPTVVAAMHTNGARTFAVTAEKGVFGWGLNFFGALGTGGLEHSDQPTPISMVPDDAVDIAVGFAHTLALRDDGSVVAWGRNNLGQLGDGTTLDSQTALVDVSLPGTSVAIAAGSHHSLALLEDGRVYAWGHNDWGQTTGFSDSYATPRQVPFIDVPVAHIAAGPSTAYAVDQNGIAYAWGENRFGQAGHTLTLDRLREPRVVDDLPEVTTVVACQDHAMALAASGEVYAWGSNTFSQLGNEGEQTQTSAARVLGVRATAMACTSFSSFALRQDGSVLAWGSNFRGLLGAGIEESERSAPAPVPGLSDVRAIAAGANQVYALKAGRLLAWGENDDGELGLGHAQSIVDPAPVADSVDVVPSESDATTSGEDFNLVIPGCQAQECRMNVRSAGGGYIVRDAGGVSTYIDGLQLGRLRNLSYSHDRWGRRYY